MRGQLLISISGKTETQMELVRGSYFISQSLMKFRYRIHQLNP